MHRASIIAALVAGATALPLQPAAAFTTPFSFHCRGNACRAIAFADEGAGCTVVTNYSGHNVHVTQGPFYFDLAPGETHAELLNTKCAGYYDGGETASFY